MEEVSHHVADSTVLHHAGTPHTPRDKSAVRVAGESCSRVALAHDFVLGSVLKLLLQDLRKENTIYNKEGSVIRNLSSPVHDSITVLYCTKNIYFRKNTSLA